MSVPTDSSQSFFSRRSFFRFSSSLAAGLGLAPLVSAAKGMSSVATSSVATSPAAAEAEDYYAKLGVRTIINAAGTYTTLTAACMPPEVLAAVQKAALHPVRLHDLQQKAGEGDGCSQPAGPTAHRPELEVKPWQRDASCMGTRGVSTKLP